MNETIKENVRDIMNKSMDTNEMINDLEKWLIKQADIFIIFNIVTLLILLTTFVVYSILPELRNIHGYMLCRYVGSMFIGRICFLVIQLIKIADVGNSICVTLAFVTYFFLLAAYFWLSVISFDMWNVFRNPLGRQENVRERKQQERKKIILYSIYAWGSPLILIVVCSIMEFVPNVPENLIRPRFGIEYCWFSDDLAIMFYCYVPMSINVTSSICLSIYTALKITHYEKKSTQRLSDMESRRHNNNKQWFNLYLKLFIVIFIVMGINWTLIIISAAVENTLMYILYPSYLMDMMYSFGIFIIFVCKKKIMQFLLQRFGCQNCIALPKNRQATVSSSTCITTLEEIPMQDNKNSCGQANCHANASFDSTEL